MLSIAEIGGRSAIALLAGIALIAGMSTYTAQPHRKGPVSLWIVLPLLAGQISLIAGCCGIGTTLGRMAAGELPGLAAGLFGFLGMLWSSSIAIQVVQNWGYKFMGAPPQRIRWSNAPRSTPKRRSIKRVAAASRRVL